MPVAKKEKAFVVRKNGEITVRQPKPGRADALRANLEANGFEIVKTAAVPSLKTLERWADDGVCNALDGCRVEPDGVCSHSMPSWLLALRMI